MCPKLELDPPAFFRVASENVVSTFHAGPHGNRTSLHARNYHVISMHVKNRAGTARKYGKPREFGV